VENWLGVPIRWVANRFRDGVLVSSCVA
jgi:hypothetical protein